MMSYRMNSGDITVPKDWVEETLHIFKAREEYNLVMNSEAVPDGVSSDEHLKKQQQLFKDNLEDYEEINRQAIAFAGGTWPLLEYRWSSPEGRMHQINLMYISDQTLTSFTFTSTESFSPAQKKEIMSVLKSFQAVPEGG